MWLGVKAGARSQSPVSCDQEFCRDMFQSPRWYFIDVTILKDWKGLSKVILSILFLPDRNFLVCSA